MSFLDVYSIYTRSFRDCFCKKRILSAYPFVALCFVLSSLYLYLLRDAASFTKVLFFLLPLAVALSLFSFLGTRVANFYRIRYITPSCSEKKLSTKQALASQMPALSLVVILAAVLVFSGLFVLISHIPFIKTLLAFLSSPLAVLLVLFLLAISFASLFCLFVLPPYLAFSSDISLKNVLIFIGQLKKNLLPLLFLFILSALPLLAVSLVFALSSSIAFAASASSFLLSNYISAALLTSLFATPCILFFFQAAFESFWFFRLPKIEGK